ncbi:SAM-dependent methyltransferase [Pendulispora brunnea]|uniref:S-adenosyl-L-methionine-dependent methyltransferase n=1 Tax=Pendulispora brunnea TaxID=2905690 RepID=A0ABZ2JYW9_9BACT
MTNKAEVLNPVAITGLLVAAMRADESTRPDRLFEDPFAAILAGERGKDALATYRAAVGPSIPIIEVRTRFYDEGLERAADDGIRQVVLVAAGADARAYRLRWHSGTRVFELDQPAVLAYKAAVLAGSEPTCERVPVPVDLAKDFSGALRGAGFDSNRRTAWVVEGLLQYLEEPTVKLLFERIDALSAAGSVVLYDAVGRAALRAPQLQGALTMMKELGAPWIFGSDEPASLLPRWNVQAIDPGDIGRPLGRWPIPAPPPNTPARPLGYLLEARKA